MLLALFALQICGGVLYLLNKLFMFVSERMIEPAKRHWKIAGWVVYLFGLPMWLYYFGQKHNWIAMAVEVGGAPSMVLGLVNEWRGKDKTPHWLYYLAVSTVVLGLGCSLLEFSGLTKWTQVMEIGISVGFLIGTYQLAQRNPNGYLWCALMSGSALPLLYLQIDPTREYVPEPYLIAMQVLSVIFVMDAYRCNRQRSEGKYEKR